MGVLEELDSAAPTLGVLDVLDGRIPVKGHIRGKPTKAERRAAVGNIPLTMAGPGGPITLDRETVAGALPTVAAIPAGIFGGPVGAALAGSAGELGSQLMMGESPDPMRISKAGTTQGLMEGVGVGLGAIFQAASKPTMELALKHSPEVAMTALREGINATKFGFNKLMSKLGVYGGRTDRIVAQASKYGRPYDMVELLRGAYADIFPKVKVSVDGSELAALKDAAEKFAKQNSKASGKADLVHRLKKAADTAARFIYNLPPGVKPTPAQEAVYGFYKAYADRARRVLNATVEGYEASNAPTEALIKLKDALRPLTKKEMSLGASVAAAAARPLGGAAVGGIVGGLTPGNRGQNAAVGAGIGALAGTPSALSSIALGMNSPLLQLLLRQAPRSIGGIMQNPAY